MTAHARSLIDSMPDSVCVGVNYSLDDGIIARNAFAGRFSSVSRLPLESPQATRRKATGNADLAALWNVLQLDGKRPHVDKGPKRPRLNIVDLFCGCGGLSLGIKQAAESVGARPVFIFAADVAEAALKVYAKNLRPLRIARQNVETLIDYPVRIEGDGVEPDVEKLHMDRELASVAGSVDVFVAGPPCEGNSNFNNRTRRFDHRNDLYLDATIAGIALDAKVIVIENVPMVTRSRQNVVSRSLKLLQESGYGIHGNEFTLTASDFGAPQNRRRHFLIASQINRTWTSADFDALKIHAPTALEAIDSLREIDRMTTFDRPSRLSSENAKRVRFLLDRDKYDLPDQERPDCHRLKPHNYQSIYGRMRPDEPAPTITTGFLSPGRGRFTHPVEARSLTPHEGARLQGFGESFDWLQDTGTVTRHDYANMIGAAVPPQLGFTVGMLALSLL